MNDYIEKKKTAILRILAQERIPLSSEMLTEKMTALGYPISERTVRLHLAQLDKEGFTEALKKQGRLITEAGLKELSQTKIYEKLGFLTAKIHQMTYAMNFDLTTMSGTVVVNLSLIHQDDVQKAVPLISRVFEKKYSMGELAAVFGPGQTIGNRLIPNGYLGLATVCSITINGILLKAGIPAISRFGGLLEITDHQPKRFVDLINYDGTTLDPLEIFIKSGMTDYLGATSSGNGLIGASFREVPSAAYEKILKLSKYLDSIGLHSMMVIGKPDQQVCEIPVSAGCLGIVLIGGLNPVAILEESGLNVDSHALSALLDYSQLFPYQELGERINQLVL